jgi:gamma-D-glutamyl-L-lysine dipeptidyl-peptidase
MEVAGKNDAREKFKFRYVVRSVVICALLVGWLAIAQQSVPNADLVVSRPVANMYKSATADSEVTSQVLYGTGVRSLEKQGDWINIRTADGYSGWIASADANATNGSSRASGGKLVRVTALSANVYREPDVTEHAPVLRLPWESILEVAADSPKDDARWLKVRLVDGQTAWVQHGDVEEKGVPLSIEETLRVARRFLGATYTWGGTSSFGFDCSGFTQMLVRQRGIEMPRDADLQAGWSGVISVDRKDLQPGDLLFFGSNASRITHTGMYLGRGEFIHDTTHDHPGVQISRIDDMPWTKLLVATRRVK